MRSLLLPGGALLLGVVALVSLGWLTLALPALSFLYYCAIAGGMLLAWRFHSSRIVLAVSILFMAEGAIAVWGGAYLPVLITAADAVAVLVPLDFVLIALMQERGFTAESLKPVGLFLFVETIVVAVLCRTAETRLPSAAHPRHLATTITLPNYTLVMFAAAAAFLAEAAVRASANLVEINLATVADDDRLARARRAAEAASEAAQRALAAEV